jgi:hypothetical protein
MSAWQGLGRSDSMLARRIPETKRALRARRARRQADSIVERAIAALPGASTDHGFVLGQAKLR